MMKKYKKILVANRGEIALRIIRTLKEMGIRSVAIYTDVEREAPYLRLADETVCIGAPGDKGYLDTYKILSVADIYKVDAIHPGIGFLAESGNFAKLCEKAKIDFIGPTSRLIDLMGDKSTAKKVAKECGVPVVEGTNNPVNDYSECEKLASEVGYPLVLKATHGGGGKGIRFVEDQNDLKRNFDLCVRESNAAFNNSELLIERAIYGFKHIEVQILADKYGNAIHLGDRECTIQRANQKLIEEARCQSISEEIREKLYQDSLSIVKKIGYIGPGTVEFLVLSDDSYYFMEMNTRLQVEHTITELVTRLDLVKEQVSISEGNRLNYAQEDIRFDGYALQCRIIAEDPKNDFAPSFGQITKLNLPSGLNTRVDSGYLNENVVTPYFDSLLLKVCCKDDDKEKAVKKMQVCLDELIIQGVRTNTDFLQNILNKESFLLGKYNHKFVEEVIKEGW